MKFLIEPYVRKRTEELSFVQLSPEAIKLNNYVIPNEGLDVPLITEDLAYRIKTKEENEIITAEGIVKAMVYLLGIDSNFKYKDEYIKFLYAVNPDIEKYINYQVIKLADEGNMIESIIWLKALLVISEENIHYLFNYGLSLLKYANESLNIKSNAYKDFKKEATIYFEKVLDIDEDFTLAYYHLGFLYSDNKEISKAKLYWEKYLELDKEEIHVSEIKQMLLQIEDSAKYERAYEAILAGRAEEGLPLLLELEHKYEKWWNLLFFIGLAYRQLLQYENAIIYFNKVLKLEENQVDSLAELGLSYGGLGNYIKSIESFTKALEIGGENSEILCNLAMIYMEVGDYEKAKECIDHSLYLDADDEVTKACNERLNILINKK